MLLSVLPYAPQLPESAPETLYTFTLLGILLALVISWIAYAARALLPLVATFFMGAGVIVATMALYPVSIDQHITLICTLLSLFACIAVMTAYDNARLHAIVKQPLLMTVSRLAFGVIILGVGFELLMISAGNVSIINERQTKMIYGGAYIVLLLMCFLMEMKVKRVLTVSPRS